MVRGIKRSHIFILLLVALALSGVINFAFGSFAAPENPANEKIAANSNDSTIKDTTPPSVPSELSGNYRSESNSVALFWTGATDNVSLEGYEVERKLKTEEKWQKITETILREYVDFAFNPGQSYEYRVRALDAKKNYSGYSNALSVTVGTFQPNVTVKDGGDITDNTGVVTASFPSNAIVEDIYVFIEKVNPDLLANAKFEKNTKLIGNGYSVMAKNSKGQMVGNFNTQIVLSFSVKNIDNISEKSVRLGTLNPDNTITVLHTYHNPEKLSVATLTNHFSIYLMTAPKTSIWITFLKIIVWLFLLGGVGYGGYVLWQKYQLARYQKEHKEDYIYKH